MSDDDLGVIVVTPSNGGGMLHYSSQMSSELGKQADVTVIVDEGADESLFENVDVVSMDFPASVSELGAGTVRLWRELYDRFSDAAVDVVHATVLNPLLVPPIVALTRQHTVFTLHDPSEHSGEEKVSYEMARRALIWKADRILVHGDFNYQQCEERYGIAQKLLRINHGDYSFFTEYCEKPIRYDREILFFGRLRPYKGIDTLIEADRSLSETVDNYRLTIAGNGPLDAGSAELGDHVTAINQFIPNEQVCELFSRCRAVVLPYREATQSGIVPIAYAFRKPVVATRVGGLPEVIEDGRTGYLVDPDRPTQLSDACQRVLENKDKAIEMGDFCNEYMKKRMSWEKISNRIITEGYRR